jgi:hypothetical protein
VFWKNKSDIKIKLLTIFVVKSKINQELKYNIEGRFVRLIIIAVSAVGVKSTLPVIFWKNN